MKVHLVQFSPLWEDKEANFARVEHLIESSSPEPHSLVVLPEAFATGFSLNLQVTCGGEPEQTHAFLSRLSSTHKVWIMAGCISPDPSGALGRNVAVLFDPEGRYVGEYQKMYPFTPMGEDKKHMAGQEPKLFNIKDFRLCPLLCYDLRFPELFRTSVKKGANLFVVLASWPDSRMSHWHALLLARAIENQAYVIGVNRTGSDPNHKYVGGSKMIDPMGKTLVEAAMLEELVSFTLEHRFMEDWRSSFPALQDIREDLV
ncbi:MAG: carbon-nitrogen family hydrolase [Verrucomicrobia bacterium]|nr:carbon-nitrogen family hydrolase [Verrucomicrobiota bacterium]MDA1077438.1 carbon-nitrogen family hydrolase [Verrucomicrobiota bacterium]